MGFMLLLPRFALAQEGEIIKVGYIRIALPKRPTLSNLDPIPDDLGVMGARLAVEDNNTTGKFLGYRFLFEEYSFDAGDVIGAISALEALDTDFVLLDMNADEMLALADAAPDKLLFNIRAYDDELRAENCRANLLHSLPSYAMRADALMQFLYSKRWTKLALVEGHDTADKRFATALRVSAEKLQLKFKSDVKWKFDGDIRRSAGSEVGLFSQEFGEYDVLLVADEANDFARYLAYNTWLPRPVAGGDGLQSKAWSSVIEQWGAAQLQSRFVELSGRDMQDVDYAAWVSLRAIDEAYIRTKSYARDDVKGYLTGDLELAGFKGRPLSYRHWDGQLRQPIALVQASSMVAMAPLEGFLHQVNELDSLGVDAPQSECRNFGGSE